MGSTVQDERLKAKLAVLESKEWFPQELLTLVERVSFRQVEARKGVELSINPENICGEFGHRQGAPLLARELFPLDTAAAERLFRSLLDVAESLSQLRTASQLLRDGMVRGELRPAELFREYAMEKPDAFLKWAKAAPDAPNLLPFLVYNSMVPWLEAAGEQLFAAHPLPSPWSHGHCPVCGSPVFIGYIESGSFDCGESAGGDAEVRFHTCSYCRTTFRAKSRQCAFCLEDDPAKMDSFTADSGPGYQVHICRSCKSYVKIADFREQGERNFIPALDDLQSLPLDVTAQHERFHRVAPSEWGL